MRSFFNARVFKSGQDKGFWGTAWAGDTQLWRPRKETITARTRMTRNGGWKLVFRSYSRKKKCGDPTSYERLKTAYPTSLLSWLYWLRFPSVLNCIHSGAEQPPYPSSEKQERVPSQRCKPQNRMSEPEQSSLWRETSVLWVWCFVWQIPGLLSLPSW